MSRRNKIIYWISTVWLATGMISTGIEQILKGKQGPGGTESLTRLGYPLYFLTLIGAWKILGSIAVLLPRMPLLKEWAYAGFFFTMSGAVFSHLATGSMQDIIPSVVLLLLTVISWYFRPSDKKIAVALK